MATIIAGLLVLVITLPASSAAEGLTIGGSVFPQFWKMLPKVEGAVVARLDRFEFPMDLSRTTWEYQERVYLWMPRANSQQQAFTAYKAAVMKRGWSLSPPYDIENLAVFGTLRDWGFDIMGVTWPVVGRSHPIYSWKRNQSPNGYTVYLNEKAAMARGFGVLIQVAPPLPPGFR